MKWVCQRDCYWNKRWTPGDIYEGTRADFVPHHFEPLENEQMADEAREIAMLRQRCQDAGIFYQPDWNIPELEKALGVGTEDSDFRAPRGQTVVEVDKRRQKVKNPRPALMKQCKEYGLPFSSSDTVKMLQKKIKDHEKSSALNLAVDQNVTVTPQGPIQEA